ncbi:methyl-accepting chemotaxis protein [Fulvimarina sp. 2208YS6-2-32]|uniref:Methyl-accepting chemotaxis protein n=1 Tax=Fulvimarina uroteuthidis TaxID=3098149 RepID=A0ABU5I1F7_9HYPH|nr:methyl-accepting chemotaxis protein [Fulvimarina sp. 2208YS6-2-32]MDY8109177.1 methyl-accepting chemotaxis protein [Fulvimarina sp. 2208YS6-2-32]
MRLTISRKLTVLIALAVLVCITVVGTQLYSLRQVVQEQRVDLIRTQVDSAVSIVERFRAMAESGQLSQDAAKEQAKRVLGAMRYGADDYFFVTDDKAVMLVHPKTALIGQNMWENRDPDGFPLFQNLIAQAKAGGGITPYLWPRAEGEAPVPKLSYSAGVPEWQWVIGTGVYVDDLSTIFLGEAWKSLALSSVLLGLLVACAVPLVRSISRPLHAMTGTMRALAAGNTSVTIPGLGRRDEIGEMADAVEAFKRAGMERDVLSTEAEAARAAREIERIEQEAAGEGYVKAHEFFMAEVTEGFRRLADGDLTSRLDRPFTPDYEGVRTLFNDSVEKLETAFASVVTTIGSIRSGLGEITTASNDLAQRTEQQAASLEETVAALGEVTQGVNETAEGAGTAQRTAVLARARAQKGGEVVGNAVTAMGLIEQSSEKINAIISVIDEIAFQTNLLALNAGVEAARAGEAGRGFAVVAQEVRGLAQRSAEAAKEIKTLIATSREQVETGVELVTASGRSLEEIVTEVSSMADVISTIASSAREQATSLREVSAAADQMDKVTQQNAAMVEQATAASHTLEQETDALALAMSRFRIGSAHGASQGANRQTGRRASAEVSELRRAG